MGEETYDKFIKDGKIDIESGENTYTLYLDGRVINKTTNQKYCIVSDRPDYPNDDILAIKFAWLKYGINTVEKVAVKSSIIERSIGIGAGFTDYAPERGIYREIGYDAFVHHMEMQGWRRKQLTLTEHNANIVTTRNIEKGYTGGIINVRCPTGVTITMMGISQIPNNMNRNIAHHITLRIADRDNKEIDGNSEIRINKIKPSEAVITLARGTYSQFSLTRQIGNPEYKTRVYKTDNELYRWRMGTMLRSEEILEISIINSDITILSDNIRINMGADLWLR